MSSAEMLRCDCWDSVGAAGDQGFFIYNYLVLQEAKTLALARALALALTLALTLSPTLQAKTFAAAGPHTPWADRWPLSLSSAPAPTPAPTAAPTPTPTPPEP